MSLCMKAKFYAMRALLAVTQDKLLYQTHCISNSRKIVGYRRAACARVISGPILLAV